MNGSASPEHARPLALVTGVGRSCGIGAAVARRLAADGFDVACTYWRAYDEKMPWGADDGGRAAVLRDIEIAGARGFEIEADLADPASVPGLFEAIDSAARRPVSVVVLSHAEGADSGLLDTTVESFDRHYAVNVRASWLLIREFALRFTMTGADGRVIALTSDHTVGNLPYGSSKGALDRIVLATARELEGRSVTANVINPGPTDTGWMSEQLKADVTTATPLHRLGQPEDVANLVSFLCSEQGGWINGQLLFSNGGFAP